MSDGVIASPAEEGGWRGAGVEPYEVGDPGRAAREVEATLPANPSDPADTQVDGGAAGQVVVRAASVRGTAHRHAGTPRQDDYAIALAGDEWIVVAVADGVSAGALSHQAATLACRGAAGQVRDALADGCAVAELPWADVLGAVARRIVVHGMRTLEGDVEAAEVARTMATTLVVTVLAAAPDEAGEHPGIVFAFGDCSVFALSAGTWAALTAVKNAGADVASNATAALPYLPEVTPEAVPVSVAAGSAVFVMTDGVGDPLGDGDGDVGSFLGTVWSSPPDLLSFGAQVAFARRSFDDDRTVVGIWVGP